MEDGATIERSWSKTLFGNHHMLEVASSIARAGVEFTAPQLERDTGLSASSVHRLLTSLSSVDLVSRVPRRAGERVQLYRRERHPFWKAMTQMRDRAHGAAMEAPPRNGYPR